MSNQSNNMSKNKINKLTLEAVEMRKTILSMIKRAHASHIGSSFSIVEILIVLYEKILKINPSKPMDSNRDRLILSKGWGISALYTILAKKKFFNPKLLETYCMNGSKLIGCSTNNGIPGVEVTTGSMGHGLPLGVGMALSAKIRKKNYRVFVIISDGECDEGSTWEAILQAGNFKLGNLIVIVDYNKFQSFGRVKDILDLEPFQDKWRSFKWVPRVINGHSWEALLDVFTSLPFEKDKPSVIIANTIKGKGVSVFEDKNEYHYKTPTNEDMKIAERELKL